MWQCQTSETQSVCSLTNLAGLYSWGASFARPPTPSAVRWMIPLLVELSERIHIYSTLLHLQLPWDLSELRVYLIIIFRNHTKVSLLHLIRALNSMDTEWEIVFDHLKRAPTSKTHKHSAFFSCKFRVFLLFFYPGSKWKMLFFHPWTQCPLKSDEI